MTNYITEEPTTIGAIVEDSDGDRYEQINPGSWKGLSPGNQGEAFSWREINFYGPIELIGASVQFDTEQSKNLIRNLKSVIPRKAYVQLAEAFGIEPNQQIARVTLEIPVTDFDTAGNTKDNFEEMLHDKGVPQFIIDGVRSVQVGPPGLFS